MDGYVYVCMPENSLLQVEKYLVFFKCFSEFAKGIYETCAHNVLNFALVFFSIVQFILLYILVAIISEKS